VADILKSLPAQESEEGEVTYAELDPFLEQSWTVEAEDGVYRVFGALAQRLLDSVNLEDNISVQNFQRQLRRHGIVDALRKKGAQDGDTVDFCGTEFEFME